jgi:FkbM family methyltransferase
MPMIVNELRYLYGLLRGQTTLKLSRLEPAPRFRIRSRMEARKLIFNKREQELLELFLSEIREGDTVFDIGANIGQFALPAAVKVGNTGSIRAFEPAPLWLNGLRENLALNDLTNVYTYNVGLSDEDGIHQFSMKNVQGSGMGSVVEGYDSFIEKGRLEKIQVRLVRGDEYRCQHNIPAPDIVKIDAEGAEAKVLRGLQRSLRREDCRFVLCEVHPVYMTEPPKCVEELLKDYMFICESTDNNGNEDTFHIFARKVR